jgi:diketogulonate reductase-like aldo/keto reductase
MMTDSLLQPFAIDPDGIAPAQVPFRMLATGAKMPAIGAGTFGSDHVTPDEVAAAVRGAIACGYRHLDCASVYGNEDRIGEMLRGVFPVIPREEFFITSKVWNDAHAPEAVAASCRKSIADLGCGYLNLYLVHWPFPNFHPPFCDGESRSADAVPFAIERFMATWRAMEQLVDEGLVKTIGTSNVTIPKLELILPRCRIRPAVNEMELHPHFQQPELFEYVQKQGIVVVGYSPIGSPARPERDKTPEDTVDVEDPVMVEIAQAHGIHPATLCVKWAAQRGQVPIPFSTKKRNYLANLKSLCTDPLSDEDMARIAAIDRGCRLIKGQVFLWESARGWEDLWDLDGTIAR